VFVIVAVQMQDAVQRENFVSSAAVCPRAARIVVAISAEINVAREVRLQARQGGKDKTSVG
jgi:hypothetical protein